MSEARSTARGDRPAAMFTFASGGWVVALAVVISVALALFWVVPVLRHPHPRPVGDGRNVASYGFDLSASLVPRAEFVASGMPKDGLPSLDAPLVMPGREVDAFNRAERDAHRSKYLVPSDRVIGVVVGDEARAYPLQILAWHEVANDRLGGREIAVTYNPLGDSAVVLDRRSGDETLSFGVSGLFYNSTAVLYDRHADTHRESLWVPLQMRAVAGPAAASGRALAPLPFQLTTWAAWSAAHPGTSVLRPDPRWASRYKDAAGGSYYGSDALRFPVRPLPPDEGMPLKTPCVILATGSDRAVVPLAGLAPGSYDVTLGGRTARLHVDGDAVSVDATDGGPSPVLAHAFWFAWYAMHPDDRVVRLNR